MNISPTQKKIIIVVLVLTAAAGGYYYYTTINKKTVVKPNPQPATNPLAKYEGKNIAGMDASGNYDGGAVYLIKNGKKMWYGNNNMDNHNGLNWDAYVAKNGNDVILVSKTVIDSIPNA